MENKSQDEIHVSCSNFHVKYSSHTFFFIITQHFNTMSSFYAAFYYIFTKPFVANLLAINYIMKRREITFDNFFNIFSTFIGYIF